MPPRRTDYTRESLRPSATHSEMQTTTRGAGQAGTMSADAVGVPLKIANTAVEFTSLKPQNEMYKLGWLLHVYSGVLAVLAGLELGQIYIASVSWWSWLTGAMAIGSFLWYMATLNNYKLHRTYNLSKKHYIILHSATYLTLCFNAMVTLVAMRMRYSHENLDTFNNIRYKTANLPATFDIRIYIQFNTLMVLTIVAFALNSIVWSVTKDRHFNRVFSSAPRGRPVADTLDTTGGVVADLVKALQGVIGSIPMVGETDRDGYASS